MRILRYAGGALTCMFPRLQRTSADQDGDAVAAGQEFVEMVGMDVLRTERSCRRHGSCAPSRARVPLSRSVQRQLQAMPRPRWRRLRQRR